MAPNDGIREAPPLENIQAHTLYEMLNKHLDPAEKAALSIKLHERERLEVITKAKASLKRLEEWRYG